MSETITRKRLQDLPPLRLADLKRLAKLADLPDSEIDLSDIPELTAEDWAHATTRC